MPDTLADRFTASLLRRIEGSPSPVAPERLDDVKLMRAWVPYPLPPPRSLTLTEMALAYLAARTERPLWPGVR